MARSGTPIRLVREDGKLIELNATKIVMSTDRRFGPKSVPFSGSNRYSIDLNLNKAVILIQGFFSDDEIEIGGTKAKATIDFNRTSSDEEYNFAVEGNNTTFFAASQSTKLSLVDANQNIRQLNMVSGNTNSYTSGTQTVTIRNDATASQIATVVKSGLDTTYSSYFSTEQVNGGEVADSKSSGTAPNNSTNSMLIITQNSIGTSGNNEWYPKFSINVYDSFHPFSTGFAGGTNASKKSAGDKAQDMYSIMNNSSRSAGAVLLRATFNQISRVYGLGSVKTLNVEKGSDYIVGILIPFNSLQTDNNYTPKNFFMPTGLLKKGEKDSTNAMVAGTKFSEIDNFTGISGGMKNMEIMYDAGEAIYTFDMQFLPSDVMI